MRHLWRFQERVDRHMHQPRAHRRQRHQAGNLALASRQIGLFEQARSYAQLAIESKQAATKIDTSSLLKSYNELAVNNRMLGSYADALAAADKVLELATAQL